MIVSGCRATRSSLRNLAQQSRREIWVEIYKKVVLRGETRSVILESSLLPLLGRCRCWAETTIDNNETQKMKVSDLLRVFKKSRRRFFIISFQRNCFTSHSKRERVVLAGAEGVIEATREVLGGFI